MSITNQLRSLAAGVTDQARDIGLPVDAAQRYYSERLEPLLIKKISRFAIPFVRRSGVRVLELESGRVVCEMPLKGNVNHIGTMYAGALFTLAEFPGGPLMLGTFGMSRFIPIVTSLDMAFLKAAKSNVRITLEMPSKDAQRIEAETLEHGKAEFVLEGDLIDEQGDVVARSLARYQMRPRRR